MITSVENHPVAQPGMLSNDAAYENGPAERSLGKRAITRAAKGIAAVQKLLTGAKTVTTESKNFRVYKKNGNYETALQDFYSVKPVLTNPKQNRPHIIIYRKQTCWTNTYGNRWR